MLNINEILINYINKYGHLSENDTLILLDDIKTDMKIKKIKEENRKKREELKKKREEDLEYLEKTNKKDKVIKFVDKKIQSKRRGIFVSYFLKLAMIDKDELGSLKKTVKKSLLLISGLSLATLLIHTAYSFYEEGKNVIIKKCNSKKGVMAREICLKKNKIELLKKRLAFLNKNIVKCNYSKHPVECRAKLNEEILKVKEKLKEDGLEFGRKMKLKF